LSLSLLPRAAIVGAAGVNSCCKGQSAGHCTISLRKIRRPKPEQMCGAKSSENGEGVTLIAEEDEASSQSQTAIARPATCHDCPGCTLAYKRSTRDKSFLPTQQTLGTVFKSHHPEKVCRATFRSLSQFKPIKPRGPPVT